MLGQLTFSQSYPKFCTCTSIKKALSSERKQQDLPYVECEHILFVCLFALNAALAAKALDWQKISDRVNWTTVFEHLATRPFSD